MEYGEVYHYDKGYDSEFAAPKPGEFVSGEVIRQAAGVSRAAVSKAVAVLRQEGHEIESVTNRGYRLISLADSLRPEELRQRLQGTTSVRRSCVSPPSTLPITRSSAGPSAAPWTVS
ncbi:MAG: HTH domain-containing protein [Oscillospiraceae bacterium]